jgi:hypothetical protein
MIIRPCKIQHAQPIDPRLVHRRRMHTMHTRFNQSACERRQCITRVNCNRPILRPNPLPLPLGIQDLECSNRLSE